MADSLEGAVVPDPALVFGEEDDSEDDGDFDPSIGAGGGENVGSMEGTGPMESDEDEDEDSDFPGSGDEKAVGGAENDGVERVNALAALFGRGSDDDEDEDESEDGDYDPNDPDSDSSDAVGAKRRPDPSRYVPTPKRRRAAGAEGEIEGQGFGEGSVGEKIEGEDDPISSQILTMSTMLLSNVFSFLDLKDKLRASRVCSAWNTPLVNYLELNLDFSPYPYITDRQIETVLPKFTQVRQLKLDGCRNVTDVTLEALGIQCPLLRSLSMNRCPRITDKGIRSLARCQRLEYLLLWKSNRVTLPAIQYLMNQLPYLISPIHSAQKADEGPATGDGDAQSLAPDAKGAVIAAQVED